MPKRKAAATCDAPDHRSARLTPPPKLGQPQPSPSPAPAHHGSGRGGAGGRVGHERAAAHLAASEAVVARMAVATAVADGGGSNGCGCGGGSVSSDGGGGGGDAQVPAPAAGGGRRAGGARRRRPRGHLHARGWGEVKAARGHSSSPSRGQWGGGTAGGPLAWECTGSAAAAISEAGAGSDPWRQPTAWGVPKTPPAICRRRAVARWVRESMRRKSAWVGLLAHEARVTKPRTVGDGESTCDGHRGPESLPDRAWARCHECLPRCGRALCGRHSAFSDARGCRAAQEERCGRRVNGLETRRLRVRADIDIFPAGLRSARRLACPLRCAA